MKRILTLLSMVLLQVSLVNSVVEGYDQEYPTLLGPVLQQSEMPSPIVSSLPSVSFITPQRPGMLLPPSNYVPVKPDLLHYTTNQLVHYFLKHNYSAQDILS